MPELNKAAPVNANPPVPDTVKATAPLARLAKTSPLVIALGATSAIMLIVAIVLGNRLHTLNIATVERQNHASQQEAATTLMLAQLTDAKTGAIKLQQQVDEANTGFIQLKSQVDEAKARDLESQSQLDKARAASNGFQSQMEEAKVASIRHEGEMELAKTQSTVMKAQLAEATTDTKRVQSQLSESLARSDSLQAKLATAEREIAELKKSRPKA